MPTLYGQQTAIITAIWTNIHARFSFGLSPAGLKLLLTKQYDSSLDEYIKT